MPLHRTLGLLAVLAAMASGQPALAAGQARGSDLSPLSDFGASTITRESTFLTQYGERNLVSVDQHLGLPGLTGHYAEITQTGAHNEVRTVQDGDANRLRVLQSGSDNYASITQKGYRNSVDLAQNGVGSRFISEQIGDENTIINSQPSGSSAIIRLTGDRNVIDINQSVAGLSVEYNCTCSNWVVRQK